MVQVRRDVDKYREQALLVADIHQAGSMYYAELFSFITAASEGLREQEVRLPHFRLLLTPTSAL